MAAVGVNRPSVTPVRMADLVARHAASASAIEAEVLAVLRSGHWVGGPVVARAEAAAAALFGRAGAVGVNSGTDALSMALQAVGVRPGDEVIVPALSFFATAGAVFAAGATPVVVDVGPEGCIDAAAAAAAIGPRTRAVIAVHLFGTMADPGDLPVPIIDDAAQAVGGTPPRVCGVLSAVSTYPTKTWGAAGDGGFVIGDDSELLGRVRQLGRHGLVGPHAHAAIDGLVGRNCRLDAVQAAVLCATASDIPARVARRRQIAARYDRELPSSISALPRDAGSPVHHYPVLHADRDTVRARLAERGVETAIYYPTALHRQPIPMRAFPCPVAEDLCRRLWALPVHEGLDDAAVDAVIAAVHEVAP